MIKTIVDPIKCVNRACTWDRCRLQGLGCPPASRPYPRRRPHVRANTSALAAPSPGYLRGRVSGSSLAVRRADGVGDAAVILSRRRLLALRVRPPGRVTFLNGARLFKPPVAQQVSHLNSHAAPLSDPLLCAATLHIPSV